jgi:hypothetical protein
MRRKKTFPSFPMNEMKLNFLDPIAIFLPINLLADNWQSRVSPNKLEEKMFHQTNFKK